MVKQSRVELPSFSFFRGGIIQGKKAMGISDENIQHDKFDLSNQLKKFGRSLLLLNFRFAYFSYFCLCALFSYHLIHIYNLSFILVSEHKRLLPHSEY